MINTTHTLKIERLSHEGRGVCTFNDKITFVFGALPGETVKATIKRKHRRFYEAITEEVLEPSPARVKPFCEFFGLCGGCQLQHVAPETQIEYKTQFLTELLTKEGVAPDSWLAPLRTNTNAYRHKARLGVRYIDKKDELLIGFREQASNKVARMSSCAIMPPQIGQNIESLKTLLMTLEAKKTIPQIEVAVGDNETAFIFRHLEDLSVVDKEKLIAFGESNNISIYLQPKSYDSVHKIYPKDSPLTLSYALKTQNLTFDFHPLDFTQVNPHMNQQMINQALSLLSPNLEDNLLDLFCGLGNFSLPFAKYAAKVTGVEGSEAMVKRAYHNAQLNQIENVQFFAQDLTKAPNAQWASGHYDKIIIDPPRSGAKELIEALPTLTASQILYISCNPTTFARDAGLLKQRGYQLAKVGIMDMFPHTAHVEVMGLFLKEE